MSGVTVRVVLKDIKQLPVDALIVGFHEDVRPLKGIAGELDWLLCGSLSTLLLSKKLLGTLGDVALVTSQGKVPVQKIFMVGLGPHNGMNQTTLRSAARNAAASAVGAGVKSAAIEYFPSSDMPHDEAISALFQGLNEGTGVRNLDVLLMASDAAAYEHILRTLKETPVKSLN
jgi:hypothetical protein